MALYLGIGARFEIVRNGPTGSGFFARGETEPTGEMRPLQSWACPSCQLDPGWAELHLVPDEHARKGRRDVRTAAIRALPRTLDTLAGTDYVRVEIVMYLERRLGSSLRDGHRLVEDHLERLAGVLPLDPAT